LSYEDEEIERLILLGALEPSGLDSETGEFLYTFTDKLAEVNPELYKDISSYFYTETMYLWSHGFIDMDITSSNPLVKLGPKALDLDAVNLLEKNQKKVFEEICRIISGKK
jgi:hypothetical protein